MSKFCKNCGNELKEKSKFCNTCGEFVNQQQTIKTTYEIEEVSFSSTHSIGERKKEKYLLAYLKQAISKVKNPKQMIPTIVLGLLWLVLSLLMSLGFDYLPVRILSFITFAQGGMFGGVFGAAGGIIGKVVVASFLNATLIPLFQRKKPFSGGLKNFFNSIIGKGSAHVSNLLAGISLSLFLYSFMNITQSMQNSMIGLISLIMLVQSLGKNKGLVWNLLFSVLSKITKGKTPTHMAVNRFISGMVIGFGLGVAFSGIRLSLSVWIGFVFIVLTIVTILTSKKLNKEVAVA
jgi:hypothetical protein